MPQKLLSRMGQPSLWWLCSKFRTLQSWRSRESTLKAESTLDLWAFAGHRTQNFNAGIPCVLNKKHFDSTHPRQLIHKLEGTTVIFNSRKEHWKRFNLFLIPQWSKTRSKSMTVWRSCTTTALWVAYLWYWDRQGHGNAGAQRKGVCSAHPWPCEMKFGIGWQCSFSMERTEGLEVMFLELKLNLEWYHAYFRMTSLQSCAFYIAGWPSSLPFSLQFILSLCLQTQAAGRKFLERNGKQPSTSYKQHDAD